MPRGSRETNLEVLIDLASRLPWWLAVILAAASYLVLHPFAEPPTQGPTGLHQMGELYQTQLIYIGATLGQWVLPAVFLLGGAAAGLRAYRNRKLLADAKQIAGTSDLMALSWQDFKHLVGEAFRARGFSVTETASGPDGGVDLELRKDGELHLVQCKRWRARKVGVEIVRELYGIMSARGAVGGYVVSSGVFSREAERFADGRNIELWDGAKLKAIIRGASEPSHPVPIRVAPAALPAASATPACPKCGAPMVRRTAQQGPNRGKEFWGCSTFPKCRGIRPISTS